MSTVAAPVGAAVGGQSPADAPSSVTTPSTDSPPPDRGDGSEPSADRPSDTDSASIGPAVSYRLDATDDPVPILVVFDTQPQETFQLGGMSTAESRSQMKSLANSEQERARDLLEQRRADGAASELQTFWARNALAVVALLAAALLAARRG